MHLNPRKYLGGEFFVIFTIFLQVSATAYRVQHLVRANRAERNTLQIYAYIIWSKLKKHRNIVAENQTFPSLHLSVERETQFYDNDNSQGNN